MPDPPGGAGCEHMADKYAAIAVPAPAISASTLRIPTGGLPGAGDTAPTIRPSGLGDRVETILSGGRRSASPFVPIVVPLGRPALTWKEEM
jgi:hypothetical protein